MSKISYFLIAIFAIFVGAQITEGALFVPYWQSLSTAEFFPYYKSVGPGIGKFFTIITIVAALIPLGLLIYCVKNKSEARFDAGVSTIFAILFIACFYIYFKGVNESFMAGRMNEFQLRMELNNWEKWHWSRVCIEVLSLIFLIRAFDKVINSVDCTEE